MLIQSVGVNLALSQSADVPLPPTPPREARFLHASSLAPCFLGGGGGGRKIQGQSDIGPSFGHSKFLPVFLHQKSTRLRSKPKQVLNKISMPVKMSTRSPMLRSKLKIGSRMPCNVPPSHPPTRKFRMHGLNLTTIQVDLIQMDDYPADSCAISPTALLFFLQIG